MNGILSLLLLAATALPVGSLKGPDARPDERTLVGKGTSLIGEVTYYRQGLMERVLANRLRWGHVEACADCVGLVMLQGREHLGRKVRMQRPGHATEGPFLVVDCGRFLTPGRVAEVDWQTARRWRMAGPLDGVRVEFLTGS